MVEEKEKIFETVSEVERLELRLLYEQRKQARRNFRAFWEDLPSSYKWTHNQRGERQNVALVCLMLVGVMVVAFAVGFYVPQVLTTGGQYYHLQPNLNYECPSHDFNGHATQMLCFASGYGTWYYYCPFDGRLIGVRGMNEPFVHGINN